MIKFKVKYTGNSARFKNFEAEIEANTYREAVEDTFMYSLPEIYCPQLDGSIKDCDGEIIATPEDNTIKYDGGYFYAEIAN